ncbi:TPA: hypothetical protein ACKONR_000638 [Clostridioides difficile]|uniref:hypothetical protein n=1 Tax=Clostridioides difficile TaxID=1496 RepID=UPI000826B462|nr:hypothetical protein [Clostridioides difficile]AXU29699.1 hypothetical protein CDIF102859_04073 [Clostridioides difficile]AXU33487.1 hypothetical protein CDIF102860_04088 [Clostridioides difficile]AXU37273.1 hypothetical protein CDIF102978_04088 [Clostridioides difficile]MBY1133344.1 hypothetical protein [Clostridioides difficile]MBY1884955.1 hypothetical protein [Clostridioides difficile]
MSIFAFLIGNGLILGVIAIAIPMTRRIGTAILTGCGILFLIACAILLLGKIVIVSLPFIIIGSIVYAIYLGRKKIKDGKEQNISKNMTDEERRKREEFLKNV